VKQNLERRRPGPLPIRGLLPLASGKLTSSRASLPDSNSAVIAERSAQDAGHPIMMQSNFSQFRMSARSTLNLIRYGSGIVLAVSVLGLAVGAWTARAQQPPVAGTAILNHLNAIITWYRRLASADETAGKPSDILYLENARGLAHECLQLAFQSAESEATLLPAQLPQSKPTSSPESSSGQQSLAKTSASTADRISQVQSEIDALNKRISGASARRRKALLSQRDELKSELDLEKALQDALQKISASLSSVQTGPTGLLKQIAALKRTLPDLLSRPPAQGTSLAGKPAISPSQRASGSGLLGQISILFAQMRLAGNVDRLIDQTAVVRQMAGEVRAPLQAMLRNAIREGRDLASQPATSDPAQMERARQSLDSLTARFKQVSSASLPLTQEIIVLDQCRANLAQWRSSIGGEDAQILRSVLTRVFTILIGLGLVVVLSEVWRRATVRYVRETRRRRQLLLVRRFVTGFLMAIVIALGFVTEFSSLATFAGFLTAGIAVALQTVILSVAAYFFLIGRYGVRVGDRISVSGVTGDVVDIGLVRFHMMELGGTGLDLYPTGRLVAFSNSVLFQNTPLFRQIPGTAYAWHEVAITFQRDGNYKMAQKELLEGVNSVYSEYRDDLEQQHSSIERLTDTSIPPPVPGVQLRFVEKGFELVVRYPVDLHRSSEIDTQVTKRLAEIIDAVPELKESAGPLQIRSAKLA
jgi:small-conductance mechanosensitive channel